MPAAGRESGWQDWAATGGSGELLTSQAYKQVKRHEVGQVNVRNFRRREKEKKEEKKG